jgi:twitching motility two-component system response regulator PilG
MKKRILCIDDSNTALLLLEYALSEEGFEAILAMSVEQAIICINTKRPDLILLDLSIPEVSGYEFLKMRIQLKLEDVPVIVISAFDSQDSIAAVRNLGAIDFISKPIKIGSVIEMVKKYLNQ